MIGRAWLLAAVALVCAGTAASAQTITPYSIPTAQSAPGGLAAGPDGNLWFTETNGNRIGRITPAGVVTEFSTGISPNAQLWDITTGPDGNLWFTENNGGIGRITPSGVVTEFHAGLTACAYAASQGYNGPVPN